jgi:uncharacterized protein YqiB (DUF1249 family)
MTAFRPVEKSYWLQRVCEANYRKLAGLVPGLARFGNVAVAQAQNRPALRLRLLERSAYTLVAEMTHDFASAVESWGEPAVHLRICFDSKTVEVLRDAGRPSVGEAFEGLPSAAEVLDYKWTLNYFFARWLDHCLACDYRFRLECPDPEEYCEIS